MHFANTIEHFAAQCLSGQSTEEKIAIYHGLIRNNIEGTLKKGYPITFLHLTNLEWDEIVSAFLLQAKSRSPFLWEMPKALLSFAKKMRFSKRWNIPFLDDLLHFEWMEIELYMQKNAPKKQKDAFCSSMFHTDSAMENKVLLNPEHRLLFYRYPVYQRLDRRAPGAQGHYPVLGFRHPDTFQVHFVSLSLFFACVIQKLQKNALCAQEALLAAAKEFSLSPSDTILTAGERFFRDLLQQKAVGLQRFN